MKRAIRACAAAVLLAVSAAPGALAGQGEGKVSLLASQSATIQADGPKQAPQGARYLTIEGKGKRKFACFAVLRFDGATLKSDLDRAFGTGKYRITGVSLELTQCNAPFTADGTVLVYTTDDASTRIDGPSSPLRYPYDPAGPALRGRKLASTTFRMDPSENPPKRDMCRLDEGTEGKALLEQLARGAAVTLVLCEGQSNVAATWAGVKPVGGRTPPALIVETAPRK